MKKKIFYILGVTLSFGLLGGCYAGGQTRATVVIPLESQPHTTIVRPHVLPPRDQRTVIDIAIMIMIYDLIRALEPT